MTWWDFICKYGDDDDAEARRVASFAHAFTPKEFDRLRILRNRAAAAYASIELDLDERRLRFARWLVEHGRIGEGVEGTHALAADALGAVGAPQETQPVAPRLSAAHR